MNLIIHDLPTLPERILPHELRDETFIVADKGKTGGSIRPCKGCFGCWIKTPSQCTIHDGYENMGALLSKSQRMMIISRCCYGGYSPFVTHVMNRSIPYILPYFTIRNHETHHAARHDNRLRLEAHLYGETTERERVTAQNLVRANGVNILAQEANVHFYANENEIGEVLSCGSAL